MSDNVRMCQFASLEISRDTALNSCRFGNAPRLEGACGQPCRPVLKWENCGSGASSAGRTSVSSHGASSRQSLASCTAAAGRGSQSWDE